MNKLIDIICECICENMQMINCSSRHSGIEYNNLSIFLSNFVFIVDGFPLHLVVSGISLGHKEFDIRF